MAQAPAPPWRLSCEWCDFYLVVHARGQRGEDPGAGVEAAHRMENHIVATHGRTWEEFLRRRKESRSAATTPSGRPEPAESDTGRERPAQTVGTARRPT